jgi:hypothetical protein
VDALPYSSGVELKKGKESTKNLQELGYVPGNYTESLEQDPHF